MLTHSDGRKCVTAPCSDGRLHVFEHDGLPGPPNVAPGLPACETPTRPVDVELTDDIPLCELCVRALDAWARGGSLKVVLS